MNGTKSDQNRGSRPEKSNRFLNESNLIVEGKGGEEQWARGGGGYGLGLGFRGGGLSSTALEERGGACSLPEVGGAIGCDSGRGPCDDV